MKSLIILCVLIISYVAQAKPGRLFFCHNKDHAAKISITEMQPGRVFYEVTACSDISDVACRIYGDYFRLGEVDLSNPKNTERVFRDGPAAFVHLFGYSIYTDGDKGLYIEFYDENCRD